MPNKHKKSSGAPEGEVVRTPEEQGESKKSEMSEAFQAGMMQIFGEQETYKPTEKQVDKMLELQEKSMDYTHHERTHVSPQQKIDISVFGLVVIALVAIIVVVAIKSPDQLPLTITGAIAFLTGGAGGYGLGKVKKKDDES